MYQLLNTAQPYNAACPLNNGCRVWHLGLPHHAGGPMAWNIAGPIHGIGQNMQVSGVGYGSTTRSKGWSEIRLDGSLTQRGYRFPGAMVGMDSGWISGWFYVPGTLVDCCLWAVDSTAGNFNVKFGSLLLSSTGVLSVVNGPTSGAGAFVPDLWQHVSVAYTVGITVNTITVATGTTTLNPSYVDILFGGAAASSLPCITGAMDDLRVWTRTPSSPDVQQAYLEGRARYPNALNWMDCERFGVPVWLVQPGIEPALQ